MVACSVTDNRMPVSELVDVIIPAIAEAGEDKQAKLADLTQFIDVSTLSRTHVTFETAEQILQKPATSLLTTEHAAEKITGLK